jgi:mRNA interferase RelE/StbE
MAYKVEFVPSAAKELAKLPPKERKRLGDVIDGLAVSPRPHGSQKMTDRDAYKMRVGDYRIIYEVHERALLVLVLAVGNRQDVYKRLR